MRNENKKRLFYFRAWLKAIGRVIKDDNAPRWAVDLLKEAQARIVISKSK